jgi:hypothetical protein
MMRGAADNAPASLRDLQRDLQRHLLGEQSAVCAAIVDAPPLPALERLAIYKNAYRVRLIDALHETYPVLHGLLGDELWVVLGEAFVAAHSSPYRSIRWYGRELARFMSRTPPFDESPVLSEIATLEWTLSEVFDAGDAQALQRSALAAVEPDAWAGLKFAFHPSLQRLEFHWNTAAVWKAMSNDEAPPQPQQGDSPIPWLLWRQNLQNYFRSMSVAEAVALDSALRRRSFGEICEDLGVCLAADAVPAAAAGFLAAWADSGILIGLDTETP